MCHGARHHPHTNFARPGLRDRKLDAFDGGLGREISLTCASVIHENAEITRVVGWRKAKTQPRALMRLMQIDAAIRIEDLRLPQSNHLEPLKHDRKG